MSKYPIERYLNIKMAYGASFCGGDETVVFLTNIVGVPQVWQVKIDPDAKILWPQPVTFAGDRVMAVKPSPVAGDNRLIYAHDVGGSENAQLFLFNLKTGEDKRLTDDDATMHMFGHWASDASCFSFASNKRHKGLFDLYIQAPDGEAHLVYKNDTPGYLSGGKFSPDAKRILTHHNIASFETRLLEIDIASGAARVISLEGEGVRYANATYLDDETVLVLTDKDSDFLYLATLNTQTHEIEALVTTEWDIAEFTVSKDQQSIAYTVNANGITELYLFDRGSGETRQAGLGDVPGVASELSFSSSGKRVLFTMNCSNRPANIFIWDIDTDAIRPITNASQAGIPSEAMATPELIHFPTFDKDENGQTRQIPAWLYKPENAEGKKLPIVMYVHGGPESQALPQFFFFFQYLVNNGYAVFVPNVRGSTGYGKAYSHLDDVRLRMDSVKDLSYGAEWIKQQPDLDGDRLAIYGRSYGGFMVLAAITTYPDLWAAAIDVVGVSSFVTFLENTSEYRRQHRAAEYGTLENDREFLESIAPINHIDKVTAPVFVLHGENDPRVPVSEAHQLVAALEKRGVPVDLLVFDDEGHQFTKLKNHLVEYPRVVNFLDRYLSG